MNPLPFVNIALQALSHAPALIADIETVARANWNHPLVQDAAQGLKMLAQLFEDIVEAQSGSITTLAPPSDAGSEKPTP